MQELEVVFQQEDGVSRVLEAAVLKEGDPLQVANGEWCTHYASLRCWGLGELGFRLD